MAQTPEGAKKLAARIIGVTYSEFLARIEANESWCSKGKHWAPKGEFANDRTRWNGLKSKCRACDSTQTRDGPSLRERRAKALNGLSWCRECKGWLPSGSIHAGLCRAHSNEQARKRYAGDAEYRAERRQHAHARKRGVAPVPPEGRKTLLEDFEGKCAYCPAPAETWDHVVPVSKGGTTRPGNIVPACSFCNISKRDRDVEDWLLATGRTPQDVFFDVIALIYCPI